MVCFRRQLPAQGVPRVSRGDVGTDSDRHETRVLAGRRQGGSLETGDRRLRGDHIEVFKILNGSDNSDRNICIG